MVHELALGREEGGRTVRWNSPWSAVLSGHSHVDSVCATGDLIDLRAALRLRRLAGTGRPALDLRFLESVTLLGVNEGDVLGGGVWLGPSSSSSEVSSSYGWSLDPSPASRSVVADTTSGFVSVSCATARSDSPKEWRATGPSDSGKKGRSMSLSFAVGLKMDTEVR